MGHNKFLINLRKKEFKRPCFFKYATIWWDQFGGKQLVGQICQQVNLAASQFDRKINKNDLPLLALKQQQKSFVMHKGSCNCSAD